MSQPYNFTAEHSTIRGLCFFEILSKCLTNLKGSERISVQKLKEDCLNYSKDNQWVKSVVLERAKTFYGEDSNIKDGELWQAYTLALKYDAQQMANMAISELKVQQIIYNTLIKNGFRNVCLDAICGRLDIEGRILSEIYGIKILLVNEDEKLSINDRNTIYLVKRGLNHYEKYVEKDTSDEKLSKDEIPSTSAADSSNTLDNYANLKETNKQDDTSNNLLNDFTSKYKQKNDKTIIDNVNSNIPKNITEIEKNISDSDTASVSVNNDTDNLNPPQKNKPKQANKTRRNKTNLKNDSTKLANDMSNLNITTNEESKNNGNKRGQRQGRQRNKNERGKIGPNQRDHSKESVQSSISGLSNHSLPQYFVPPNQQQLNIFGANDPSNFQQFFNDITMANDAGQRNKIRQKVHLSKQVYYDGFVNDAQEFHGNGKIVCADKRQMVEGVFKNNLLVKLKMFTFIFQKTKSIQLFVRIYGEDCLLTINRCIVARISIPEQFPFNSWTQSFDTVATSILNSVQIVKMLEDGTAEERNVLYSTLLTSIEQGVSLTTTDISAANTFLHLCELCNNNNKQLKDNRFLLQMVAAKRIFPVQIHETCERLLTKLYEMDCETKSFPKLLELRTKSDNVNLMTTFKEISAKAIQQHKTLLLELFYGDTKLEPRNWLDKLKNYQIIYIHPDNIRTFNSLELSTPQNSQFWLDFLIMFWSQFIDDIKKLPIFKSLEDIPPLTHRIFLPLFKIFIELIEEIQTTVGEPIEKLIIFNKRKFFDLKEKIKWPQDNFTYKSMDIQIRFVVQLMNHFRPGGSLKQFEYKRFFKNKSENQRDEATLVSLEENQLIWIYILDHTLSKLMYLIPKETKNHFYKLSYTLIECLTKFIEKNAKRLESLRCIVSNIIKFVSQISSYICNINLNSTLDEHILTKQMEYLTFTMANQSNETLPNYLSNVIDVYATYWSNRDVIVAKLPKIYPCGTFSVDTDSIYQLLLTIVKNVVDALIGKKIPMDIFIGFMRAYNEFVEDLDDIEYKWYVKYQSGYDRSWLKTVENKLSGEAKCSYLVENVKAFMDHLKLTEVDPIPINYITKTIIHLLVIVNNSLLKESWPNGSPLSFEMRIQISTQLMAAVRSSFLYLKEQPDYRDFELFFEESTKPFHNVLTESQSKDDFDKRCSVIKESFWYIRKQNEIGIAETLQLFAAKNTTFVLDKTTLERTYLLYQKYFNEFIQNYHLNKSIDKIVRDISTKICATEAKHNYNVNLWRVSFKQETIPYLLAGLSAIWSIQQSKDILNIEKPLKPHCIQIVCILRLLSVDSDMNGVDKHLAEVLTGQGKSLVLGLTAALLSLFDYNIKIICYSEYLSKRDESDFRPYFDTLRLSKSITYQTFENMANDLLNTKRNGATRNVRDLVRDDILGIKNSSAISSFVSGVSGMFRSNSETSTEYNKKTILLIDEVDVFFMKRFFGETYNACTTIGMNTLVRIQEEIWKMVTSGQFKSQIMQHVNSIIQSAIIARTDTTFVQFHTKSEPSRFYQQNRRNTDYFQLEVSKMIDDANKINSFEKFVSFELDQCDNIKVKNQYGEATYSEFYGYLNTFAYFKLKKTNFTHNNYKNYGYIMPLTGKISYAKLPLEYQLILGVTGTLSTLSNYQNEVIENMYKVRKQSLMPSFYGPSNIKFNPMINTKIEIDTIQWLQTIFRSATNQIHVNRAVLICFDTETEMNTFETAYSDEIAYLNKLTVNTVNKDFYITEAGVKKNITLLTRGMGRGTDFKTSVAVEKNGGCHVIQTFFSLDENEEIQIRGRTARKDNKGSYELILCRKHLNELGFIDEYSYGRLSATRKVKMESNCVEIERKITNADSEHVKTMEYLKSLK